MGRVMISKMLRRGTLAALVAAASMVGWASTAEAQYGVRSYGYGGPRAYSGTTVYSYRPAVVVTPRYGNVYRPSYSSSVYRPSYGSAYRPNYSYGYGYSGYRSYRPSVGGPWGGYGVGGGFPVGPSYGGGGFPRGPSYGGGGFSLYIGR